MRGAARRQPPLAALPRDLDDAGAAVDRALEQRLARAPAADQLVRRRRRRERRGCRLRSPRSGRDARRRRCGRPEAPAPATGPFSWPLTRAGRGRPSRGRHSAATMARSAISSASAGAPVKPSGYSSAMKPVVSSPARKRGCCISAERKSTLWPMPSIWKASSAVDLAVDRLLAGGAAGDQLGDHRIVEHRDLAALGDAVVDADALRRRAAAR